jgi:hypothetical protein
VLHSVFERAVHDQHRSLIAWAVGVAAYTAMIVVMYPMIRDRPDLTRVIDTYPEVSAVLTAWSTTCGSLAGNSRCSSEQMVSSLAAVDDFANVGSG